jgi:4-amino-4-deoxy-L-arabinose transferase-like glycosyltransferase
MRRVFAADPATASAWTSPRRVLAALALWLLATLGLRPLLLPDEGRYGTVARDMLQQGDGLVPLLNGLPFFHKPPLMYWLDMAAMVVVGVNPFAARFGAFVGAFTMGAALYLAARRWHGARAGTAAVAALATTPFFYIAAQYDNLDMLVGGMIAATVLAFVRAVDDERPALRWVVSGWALMALGVLAKGLIGIVLPAMIVVPWLLWQRRWRAFVSLLHPAGIVVFAVVALPWFVLMQQRYPGFFDYFIVEQHFRRYAMKSFNNVQGPWFFPVLLVLTTLPWSAWLPWAVRDALRGAAGIERTRLALYGWWMVVVLVFFTLPASKLVGYILPMLAPWCLWLADAATRRPRAARLTFAVGALTCLVAALVLVVRPPHSTRDAARVLAAQMQAGDRVVFVDQMFYDVPFYAGLAQPPLVASDWADPDVPLRDNWRKELFDAARFDPVRGKELLRPLDRVAELACHPHATWFFVRPDNVARLATIAGLEKRHADRDVVLLRSPPKMC